MPRYAHIESGAAIDPSDQPDEATYRRILGALPEWQIVQVDADTEPGAKLGQDEKWVNLTPEPEPEPAPTPDPGQVPEPSDVMAKLNLMDKKLDQILAKLP